MMTDEERLKEGLESIERPVGLTLYSGEIGDSPLLRELEDFTELLKQVSSKIRVDRVEESRERAPLDGPALCLGGESDVGSICYFAVPQGPELPPFIDLLASIDSEHDQTSASGWAEDLRAMDSPAEIKVFISPDCPHCPQGVRAALALSLANGLVTLSIIDVLRYPDITASFGVRSVPTTIIDSELSLVGVVASVELTRHLLERGSDTYDRQVFRAYVEGGRFAEAADLFIKQSSVQDELVERWRNSTLTERIQLMLLVEAVLERSASAFDFLLPQLTEGLVELGDASLRGDTVDLLGRIGHPASKPLIEALCHDANPDVAEIAQEVLEELEAGGRRAD